MRFAHAPGALNALEGNPRIGACGGYMPSGCGDRGYASSDVYFLEVCVFSMMCSNREELFRLSGPPKGGPMVDFRCELDELGFNEMRDAILSFGRSSAA
jgi:hypothetical protein